MMRIFIGGILEAKDAMFLPTDNEDSDQTARMSRLILVFVGRTSPKVCICFVFV